MKEELKQWRLNLKMSLRQTARQCQVSPTYLSRIELGQCPLPSDPNAILKLVKGYLLPSKKARVIFAFALDDIEKRYFALQEALKANEDLSDSAKSAQGE